MWNMDYVYTFGVTELDNNILFENVDFFNGRNGIDTYSFQGAL